MSGFAAAGIKSHRGVQRQSGRLTQARPDFDGALRAFLGRACNFKAIADDDSDATSDVSPERAAEALAVAKRFMAKTAELIEGIQPFADHGLPAPG